MNKTMTKSQLMAYRERWARVNELEIRELRKMTMPEKVKQLLTLTASMHLFGYHVKKLSEYETIQRRWQILRKRMRHAR